jgi:ornithine decarboxylase
MVLCIVVPDTHSAVPLGEKIGVEPKYIQQLTQKALELDMDVIGVSFHCGSGNHDLTLYKDAISIVKSY